MSQGRLVRRFSLLPLVAVAALIATPGSAGAATYSNPTPITIPEQGAASPYPSVTTVAGLAGTVVDVNVTITGYSHTCPFDVDILLAGPGGRQTILLSDAGGAVECSPDAVGVTITFDDEAASEYPCHANPSGTFRPTDDATTPSGSCPVDPDPFPSPAPPGPYPAALSSFDGGSPNGAWNLYVFDQYAQDAGLISGGWSLELAVPAAPPTVPAAPPTHTCRAQTATMFGTEGDDSLVGTPGPDVIAGLGGNDNLSGLGGNDVICGARGNDTLKGGKGKDTLLGQKGNDTLKGGPGNDKLSGKKGKDRLKGAGGKDKLKGGGGRDVCIGGKANDSASKCEVEKSI